MIDCSFYSKCSPANMSKLGPMKKIKRGRSSIVEKVIDLDINFDKALTGLAKILSNQEKTLLGGGT